MLFRFNEWKDNNLNILVSYFYIWSLVFHNNFSTFVLQLFFLITLLTFIGSLGYYFNDICDVEKDKRVNKVNRAQGHSLKKQVLILFLLAFTIIALWGIFDRKKEVLGLILIEFILIITYSSNFIRFKEKPILSIINDSLAAQVNLGFIVLVTVSNNSYLDYPLSTILFLTWVFFQGVKWITGHHLKDASNDRKSDTTTSVSKFGFKRVLVFNKVVLPVIEIILFSCFLLSVNYILLIIYGIYILYILLRIKSDFSSFIKCYYDPLKDLGYRMLNLFYVRYLGLIALIFLMFDTINYVYILFFHLIFFYKNTIDLSGDLFFNPLRYLSLMFNNFLYYTFLIFGINLKQFSDYSFFVKLFLIKNSKIRKPYGHEIPNTILELNSNIDTIVAEWYNFVQKNPSSSRPIDQISQDQSQLNEDKKWEAFFVYVFGEFSPDAEVYFPQLTKIIKQNKRDLTLVLFSILEPGKHIVPHTGNNHGVIRTQIGIDIKDFEKTGLRVEDKTVQLKNKDVFIFDDTFEHEAWNYSSERRVVLIVDSCKKMPYIYDRINRYRLMKLKSTEYVQLTLKKLGIAKN